MSTSSSELTYNESIKLSDVSEGYFYPSDYLSPLSEIVALNNTLSALSPNLVRSPLFSPILSDSPIISPVVPLVSPISPDPLSPGTVILTDSIPLSPTTPLVLSDPHVKVSRKGLLPVIESIDFFTPMDVANQPLYIPSIPLNYSLLDGVAPVVTSYYNLNADRNVHKKMAKFFYYKVIDKWLFQDMKHILGYFVVSGDKVGIISNMKQYSDKNETPEKMTKKVSYIEDKVFNQKEMMYILKQFIKKTNTNWYDLPKNKKYVKSVIADALINKIKRKIKGEK